MKTGFGQSELGQKAKAIYQDNIASRLTSDDKGKFLVIDTETGEYEIDIDNYQASFRAYQKNPGARNRYCVRVGHDAVGKFLLGASLKHELVS